MSTPEATPPPVCDHDAHCPVCRTCTQCYPHEPGSWGPDGVTEPCRSAALLRELNNLDALEQITQEVAGRAQLPADQGKAGSLLDDIRASRDRMLGTDDL
jgi:hypothetical protein